MDWTHPVGVQKWLVNVRLWHSPLFSHRHMDFFIHFTCLSLLPHTCVSDAFTLMLRMVGVWLVGAPEEKTSKGSHNTNSRATIINTPYRYDRGVWNIGYEPRSGIIAASPNNLMIINASRVRCLSL